MQAPRAARRPAAGRADESTRHLPRRRQPTDGVLWMEPIANHEREPQRRGHGEEARPQKRARERAAEGA